jgi:hypothetical protein
MASLRDYYKIDEGDQGDYSFLEGPQEGDQGMEALMQLLEPSSGVRTGGSMGIEGPVSDDQARSGEKPNERLPVPTRLPVPEPIPEAQDNGGPDDSVREPNLQVRPNDAGPTGSGPAATPTMPRVPTPQAAGQPAVSGPPVLPFQPMSSPSIGSMATPRLRGLSGSAGGLQGGGLGLPLDPVSNQTSDPIDTLLQGLTSKRRTL